MDHVKTERFQKLYQEGTTSSTFRSEVKHLSKCVQCRQKYIRWYRTRVVPRLLKEQFRYDVTDVTTKLAD